MRESARGGPDCRVGTFLWCVQQRFCSMCTEVYTLRKDNRILNSTKFSELSVESNELQYRYET